MYLCLAVADAVHSCGELSAARSASRDTVYNSGTAIVEVWPNALQRAMLR